MIKRLYIILLFSESIIFSSHRPSADHIRQQDIFAPYDDIIIWAHESFPDIDFQQLVSLVNDALIYATLQGRTQESDDDDIILYSQQTVLRYVSHKIKASQPAAAPLEYSITHDISELPCGHQFHASCIQLWTKGPEASCPLCKTPYKQEEMKTPEAPQTNSSCTICLESLVPAEAAAAAPSPKAPPVATRKRRGPKGINHKPKQWR